MSGSLRAPFGTMADLDRQRRRMKLFRLLIEAAFVVVAIIALSNLTNYLSESLVRSLYLPGNEIVLLLRNDPASNSIPDENSITSREIVVTGPNVELVGFAPANQQVDLTVNGNRSRFSTHVDERARFEAWLYLRSGTNHIVATLASGPEDSGAYYPSTYWTITYRPEYLRTPRVIASRDIDATRFGGAPWQFRQVVWGVAEPDSWIAACFNTGGGIYEQTVPTDSVGAFRVEFRDDSDFASAVFAPLAMPETEVTASTLGIPILQKAPADQSATPQQSASSSCESSAPYALYADAADIEAGSDFARSLAIVETASGQYTVKAVITLPQDSALYEWAEPQDWADRNLISAEEFMHSAYGMSGFRDVAAYQSRASQAGDDDYDENVSSATLTVTFRANIDELRMEHDSGNLPGFLTLAADTMTLEPLAYREFDTSASPDIFADTAGIWEGPRSDADDMWIRLRTDADTDAENEGPFTPEMFMNEATTQTSPVAAINQLAAWLPSAIRDLGVWGLLAIPFFWFARVLQKNEQAVADPFLARTRAYIATVLMLHFAYILIWFTRFDLHGIIVPRTPEWFRLEGLRLIADPAPQLVLGASVCAASLALALERPLPLPGRIWPWFRWLVLVPLAAAVIAGVSMWDPVYDELAGADLWFGVGLLVFATLFVWTFVHWLLRTVVRRRLPLRVAFIAALGIIVLPSIPVYLGAFTSWLQSQALSLNISPFVVPAGLGDIAWLIMLTLLGAWLLWVLLRLILGLADMPPPAGWKKGSIIALFLLTALPFDLVRGDGVTAWTYEIFFRHLIFALRFTVIIPVYCFLRHISPDDDFEMKSPEIALAAMLFAFYLCGGSTHLLLVPIPLLLGWYLFSERLLDTSKASREAPPPTARRADTIARLLRLKDAQRLSNGFRKQGEKAYVTAEITRQEYDQGLSDASGRVEQAAQDLSMSERDAQQAIFAYGPGDGRWSNAHSAVLYSIPIIVLFQLGLINEIFSNEYERSYPLFDIVSPLLGSTVSWLISAFLFGYLFHLIKGRNGVEKALAYAVVLLLPALVIVLLNEQPLLGESAGKRLLRIALFAFYLGLVAFDLKTLQRYNRGLKDLVSVYGLGPMIAFASSLIALGSVSIGPVITAIVSWLLGLPTGGAE